MFLGWFLYIVLILVLCMVGLILNYLIYDIKVEKLVNTRICDLKCRYAQKTLKLQNLNDRKSMLGNKLTNLYKQRTSNQNDIERCSSKLKNVSKQIDKVKFCLEMIDLKLEDLNNYKK